MTLALTRARTMEVKRSKVEFLPDLYGLKIDNKII